MSATSMTPVGAQTDRYAYVLFPRDWPELTGALNELAARYRRLRRPDAALIIERAWSEARQAQLVLGRELSALATKELRESERKTRVRPDTDGDGGPRLGDYLVAEPMPHQDLLPGAVGVANEELLDANVPWWVTNEVGNTTNIGRQIFGIFYGDGDEAVPSPDEFREHPLFMPAPSSAGGGLGTIERGIPERRFIQKALPEITRQWHARFDAIYARLTADMARASVTMR